MLVRVDSKPPRVRSQESYRRFAIVNLRREGCFSAKSIRDRRRDVATRRKRLGNAPVTRPISLRPATTVNADDAGQRAPFTLGTIDVHLQRSITIAGIGHAQFLVQAIQRRTWNLRSSVRTCPCSFARRPRVLTHLILEQIDMPRSLRTISPLRTNFVSPGSFAQIVQLQTWVQVQLPVAPADCGQRTLATVIKESVVVLVSTNDGFHSPRGIPMAT